MFASFFFHNTRYTAPREDALAANTERKIFAAADGVTRDWDALQRGEAAYPTPSPATDAADASAAAILDALETAEPSEAHLCRALEAANAAVRAVNERWDLWENPDYLQRDLAGAVAAVAWVHGNRLLAGWIGDCGVAVVRNGRLAWITRDQLDDVIAYLRRHPAVYDDARRVFTRRDLRNRPDAQEEGRPISYGVLTGEPPAESYIETAALDVQPGDVIAAHTDGFRPYFEEPDFLALLSGDPAGWQDGLPALSETLAERDDAFGKERSVWLYRHSGA
jgi:serine/threonine protein phosphatase PrpC